MPRQLRVEYPGAIYHIMSRGDRKKDIYLDDVDRQDFLKTLAETCQKTGFEVHAYCLMRNHFHLVAAFLRHFFLSRPSSHFAFPGTVAGWGSSGNPVRQS